MTTLSISTNGFTSSESTSSFLPFNSQALIFPHYNSSLSGLIHYLLSWAQTSWPNIKAVHNEAIIHLFWFYFSSVPITSSPPVCLVHTQSPTFFFSFYKQFHCPTVSPALSSSQNIETTSRSPQFDTIFSSSELLYCLSYATYISILN